MPFPAPPRNPFGSKLPPGPAPFVKKRPPLAAAAAAVVVGAVERPIANATPTAATSTAAPRRTFRSREEPPDRFGACARAGVATEADTGAATNVAEGGGSRAGPPGAPAGADGDGADCGAAKVGTGSVGVPEVSAPGVAGSKGVVMAGASPTRSAAR